MPNGIPLGIVAAARAVASGGSEAAAATVAAASVVSATATVAPAYVVPNFPTTGDKIEELRDDFTDNSINAFYDDRSSGWTEASGQLAAAVPNGAEIYFGSLTTLDMADSYFMVQMANAAPTGNARALLMAWDDTANNTEMGYDNGNLVFYFKQGNVSDDYAGSTIPFNATNHRWWRMLVVGTTLTFQTSADGLSWSNPFGVTRTLSGTWYNAVTPYLDVIGQSGAGGTFTYDNWGVLGVPAEEGAATIAATSTVTATAVVAKAPVLVQEIGRNTTMAGGTTLTVSFSGATKPQAGDWIIIRCGRDNATNDPATGDSITVTPGSESYTRAARAQPNTTSTAGAGCVGVVFAAQVGTTWAGGTNTVTWVSPTGTTAKAMVVEHWRYIDSIRGSSTQVAGSTAGAPSVTSGTLTVGDLAYGTYVFEYGGGTTTADTDTTNGSWSSDISPVMTGTTGNATTRLTFITVGGQTKRVTATATQTYNVTNSVTSSVDAVAIIVGFVPAAAA